MTSAKTIFCNKAIFIFTLFKNQTAEEVEIGLLLKKGVDPDITG